MAVGLISSLLSKKTSAEEVAQVYIVPLNRNGTVDMIGSWAFQYWPESVQIGYGANYAQRNLMGGSLPLKQWVNSNARPLSFVAEFSRDMQGDVVDASLVVPPSSVARDKFNVDIAMAIAWLESMVMPTYDDAAPGGVEPPPTLYLVFPKSQFGRAHGATVNDVFQCNLISTQAVVDAWFPDGTIRHASVQLAFEETPQTLKGIMFPGRDLLGGGKSVGEFYKVPIAKQQVQV